jgi:cobalt/nickel transport system ATP-binding protein
MEEEMDHNENWVIEAQDVSFTYEGNEEKALDGLELKIRRGSRVAFMGGNGSGKSTFFLCLNGIRKPDSGRICIDGKPIEYTRKGLLDVRGKVGIVFQEPDNQLFSASVYEEISFGILNLGADEETARREVDQVIRELEITPFKDRPAHALSGGQKKQVAIADILVMHPEVMILDEPAAALDPAHTRKVHQIVDRLTGKGITVLMATHDIDYAYRWADEIVLMHEGRVLRQGTPEAVCADRAALREAGLEPPSVLRLWECLQDKGMISRAEQAPRSTDELIRMLERDDTDVQNKERLTIKSQV